VSKRLKELSVTPRDTSPGSGMLQRTEASISLSTGVKLGQIPYITSSIGCSPSRESSRNRMSRRGRASPMRDDLISHLGIESRLSPMTSPTSEDSESQAERRRESISLRDEKIPSSTGLSQLQPSESLSSNQSTTGTLGSLEIELKYQSAQEQLIVRIVSARNIPNRYLSAGSKLYVKVRKMNHAMIISLGSLLLSPCYYRNIFCYLPSKVLIDGASKYTTPLITAREPATFQNTVAHPVSSSDLGSTAIRFSLCQVMIYLRFSFVDNFLYTF